jgi:fumarate hydratase subunit beta
MGLYHMRAARAREMVAYADLGPEAIRKLEVKDLPALVINDTHGGDLYQEGREKYRSPR